MLTKHQVAAMTGEGGKTLADLVALNIGQIGGEYSPWRGNSDQSHPWGEAEWSQSSQLKLGQF